MKPSFLCGALIFPLVLAGSVTAAGPDPAEPFLDRWALTIPGGGAGWLEVRREKGYVDASILWGGGSVVPVSSVFLDGDLLCVVRVREVERKDAGGRVVRVQQIPELLQGRLEGDRLALMQHSPRADGTGVNRASFTGVRMPPIPPRPDLSQVTWGERKTLFNGTNLAGWRLTSPSQRNGWRAENGVLINDPRQEEGRPHVSYGNLRTDETFGDFKLDIEFNVPPDGNSGVYLRGIYEVQIADSHGKEPDSHRVGGIYSRITPTENPSLPAGEWQRMEITLVDQHGTVVLNGRTIIDNQPIPGCTGGALWSDVTVPGPIYLQGDHTGVSYRNIVIQPRVR